MRLSGHLAPKRKLRETITQTLIGFSRNQFQSSGFGQKGFLGESFSDFVDIHTKSDDILKLPVLEVKFRCHGVSVYL